MKTYKVTLEDFNPPKELIFTEQELREYCDEELNENWDRLPNVAKEIVITRFVNSKTPPLIIEEIEV